MELAPLSASELIRLIQDKSLSAVDAVSYFLERIEQHNPKYNAVISLNEQAIAQAKAADTALSQGRRVGPLHGLPITIKDSFSTKGINTACGYPPLADKPSETDADIVTHLKHAGAIILGKTNVPMLAMDLQTDNPVYGRTNNPWNSGLTAGGSSGGSAVAVAAGLTPMCFGSDIGGSLRIPAHFCGVTSLKPTTRLVSTNGHIPPLPNASIYPERLLSTPGPVSNHVSDLQLGLKIIAGNTPLTAEHPEYTFNNNFDVSLGELKMAYCSTMGDLPIEKEYQDVFSGFIKTIADHTQLSQAFPKDVNAIDVWHTYGVLLGAEVAAGMPYIIRRSLMTTLRSLRGKGSVSKSILKGSYTGLRGFLKHMTKRDDFIKSFESFFEDYDILICPVCTLSAFEHQTSGNPIVVENQKLAYYTATLSFPATFNLTGHPVVTLPIGFTASNKPVGVQLVAKRWDDWRLMAIAERIETLIDFKNTLLV